MFTNKEDEMNLEKLGEFYRNNKTGQYCFICYHCGLEFGTFTDIDIHICIEHEHNVMKPNLMEIKLEPAQDEDKLCVSDNYFEEDDDVKDDILDVVVEENLTSKYECDICNQIFYEKLQIVKHMQDAHSSSRQYTCEICNNGFVYSHKKSLGQHIATFHPDSRSNTRYIISTYCDICNIELIGCRAAMKHNRLLHPNLRQYKCDKCDSDFSTKYGLVRHVKRQHSETAPQHICEMCPKSFRDINSLKTHMKTHTGQRDYSCDVCNKSFTHSSYIKIHKRTHTGEKPYQCSFCGVRFNSVSKMNSHTKLRHTVQVKSHKCSVCDKMFLTENLRNKHETLHSGLRPYQCTVCAKYFTSRKVLFNHSYLHEEKRFKCKFCDLTFAQSSGRRAHEKLRHLNLSL